MKKMKLKVMGIDLAAGQKGRTGLCVLEGKKATMVEVFTDSEIIKFVESSRPKVIAVDAPLSLPRKGVTRKADTQIRQQGIPIFSFALPSLKQLAKRGMRLAKKLRLKKYAVIETYPYAVLRLHKALSRIRRYKAVTKHQQDALICALVARAYARSKARFFGDAEGKIWY